MSRFAARAVERFDLGDGDWVDIRTRLTLGERNAIRAKLLGPTPLASATSVDPNRREADWGAANVEVIVQAVAAWGGPGFCLQADHPHADDCQPRPIIAENVLALDETGERILAEIERRLVTSTPGFTTPSSGAAADQSTTTA